MQQQEQVKHHWKILPFKKAGFLEKNTWLESNKNIKKALEHCLDIFFNDIHSEHISSIPHTLISASGVR